MTSDEAALLTIERLAHDAPRLSIGILTADLIHLGAEVELLERCGAELVHVDVMDGVYCPQLTVGPAFVGALRTSLLKDVHVMVEDPLSKVDSIVAAGADIITLHVEHASQPHRVFRVLGEAENSNDPMRGIVRGIGLTPSMPVESLEPYLDEVDLVVVLAVDPGWSGQSFIPSTVRRIAHVREMAQRSGRRMLIAVDGGVTQANVLELKPLGLDLIVAGSAIFDGRDANANARRMLAEVAQMRRPQDEPSSAVAGPTAAASTTR